MGLDAGNELHKGYAAGTGGAVGLLAQMTPRWSLQLFARDTDYTAGEAHNEKRLSLEQRYTLNKANTLRMEWTRQRQLGDDFSNFNLSWQHLM